MRRFRRWRRRAAALALLPATATTMIIATGPATGADTAPRMNSSERRVETGSRVRLEGQFAPATDRTATQEPGSQRVVIEFKAAGKTKWYPQKTTRSDRRGRYSERVRVVRSGRFRAVSADGRHSQSQRVRARAKVRAKVKEKHPKVGEKVPIKGHVEPGGSRRKVLVRVGGKKIRTHTNRKGDFKVRWRPHDTGRYRVKVKAKGDEIAAGDKDKAGKVTVFRPAEASWYGPGFWGGRTACGQTLSASTIGVANKTMDCGTKLTLRYKGRQVKAKVIDRGPYSGDREFDLTQATKEKLHFPDTGTVLVSK